MNENIKIAAQINVALQKLIQSQNLPESEAMEVADLYPAWSENKAYSAGIIIKYSTNAEGETQLYSVLQDHTSQADWTPDTTASLYKKVGFTEGGTPIWTQPLGASDAYMTGDEVEHSGKIWVSDVDNNVWEPGVYGWIEKTV